MFQIQVVIDGKVYYYGPLLSDGGVFDTRGEAIEAAQEDYCLRPEGNWRIVEVK